MKLNQLYVATLTTILPATSIFAAALESSNQSISAFLEPGNYIEAGFNVIDYNISGKTTTNTVGFTSSTSTKDKDLGKVDSTLTTPNFAVKTQINDQFSVGLIYDKPFAADINYKNARTYLATSNVNFKTKLDIDSNNIALLVGYKPHDHIQLYAAPVYQQIKGTLNGYGTHTRLLSTDSGNYYLSKFKNDDAYGWLVGLAFDNNDLKANITYRSKINHEFKTKEGIRESVAVMPNAVYSAIPNHSNITTPQSANLDISKKITESTTTSLNIRWVDWSNFELYLPYYKAKTGLQLAHPNTIGLEGGYDPISYEKDQWSINLGVDQKLNDKWKINASLGWDSGVGEYISHYTPINGSWNAGLGVQFSPASNYFVQTGFKYIWLDDVKGQHSKQIAQNSSQYDTEFKENYALSYDFKIGYRF